jgi:hypothetical protein
MPWHSSGTGWRGGSQSLRGYGQDAFGGTAGTLSDMIYSSQASIAVSRAIFSQVVISART